VHFQFPEVGYQYYAEPTPQPNDQAFVSADYADFLEMKIERLQSELDAIHKAREEDRLLDEAVEAYCSRCDDA
jgi:hypothetical protein